MACKRKHGSINSDSRSYKRQTIYSSSKSNFQFPLVEILKEKITPDFDFQTISIPEIIDLTSDDEFSPQEFGHDNSESTTNIDELAEFQSSEFTSPKGGWNKVFQKYSPSTEVLHSPIKHITANIKPKISTDEYLHAHVWIVDMSEQFYYDNSITLIYKFHDDPIALKETLLLNSLDISSDSITDTLIDVVVLGSGSFGDVFRVKKEESGEYFAVKYLKKLPSNAFFAHTKVILEYLKERNFLIKARSSPFVVQFLTSLKYPGINGLFLFFEWCVCDLRKYLKLVAYKGNTEILTNSLWNGSQNGINELLTKTYSKFTEDFFTVTLIYIFEIFCAIDFLAKCNIVHQDLKPDNIMISTNFHLKITDFGLSYNTRFITRQSQIHLVEAFAINLMESSNYEAVWGGTPLYDDMELTYRSLRRLNPVAAKDIVTHVDRIDAYLSTSDKEASPDFMSDLWACGIIAMELLLGSTLFYHPLHISEAVKKEMFVTDEFRQSILALTFLKKNYERYIEDGFVNYGGAGNEEIMVFLASIFKPRLVRAAGFVKMKEVYRYKNKVKLKHIDINKVEKISRFENMGLTSNNVFLYTMPEELDQLLNKPLIPQLAKFTDLLANIPRSDKQNFFNIEPGIQTSYF